MIKKVVVDGYGLVELTEQPVNKTQEITGTEGTVYIKIVGKIRRRKTGFDGNKLAESFYEEDFNKIMNVDQLLEWIEE